MLAPCGVAGVSADTAQGDDAPGAGTGQRTNAATEGEAFE